MTVVRGARTFVAILGLMLLEAGRRHDEAPIKRQEGRRQLQVSAQIELTSPTQMLSHKVVQQYSSCAHTCVAHGSQDAESLLPVVQMGWLHVLPPLTHWPLALHVVPLTQLPHVPLQPSGPHCLPLHWGVHVGLHDCLQMDLTSPTQMLSHFVLQQYGSWAHISVAHGSHDGVSLLPVLQMGCEHVVLPTHCPAGSHVSPLLQLPHEPLQPSGPHCLPEHWGVQVVVHWPVGSHVSPLLQLPHEPLQPSGPHCLPEHWGVHVLPFETMHLLSLFDHSVWTKKPAICCP
jgi:hypothetical protein